MQRNIENVHCLHVHMSGNTGISLRIAYFYTHKTTSSTDTQHTHTNAYVQFTPFMCLRRNASHLTGSVHTHSHTQTQTHTTHTHTHIKVKIDLLDISLVSPPAA